jgi:hypothetical protein
MQIFQDGVAVLGSSSRRRPKTRRFELAGSNFTEISLLIYSGYRLRGHETQMHDLSIVIPKTATTQIARHAPSIDEKIIA